MPAHLCISSTRTNLAEAVECIIRTFYCRIGVDVAWGNMPRAYFPDLLAPRDSKDARANFAAILYRASRGFWRAASGCRLSYLADFLPNACRQSRAMAGVLFDVACRVGTLGPFQLQTAHRVSHA